MQKLSQDQVTAVCRSKADLHQALLRNQFLCPRLQDRICTFKFLNDLRLGNVYNPKLSQIVKCVCANPPSEEFIRHELTRLIEDNVPRLPPAE